MNQAKIRMKLVPDEFLSDEEYLRLRGKTKDHIDYLKHPSAAPPGWLENIELPEIEVQAYGIQKSKLKKIDRHYRPTKIQFDPDGPVLIINSSLVDIPDDTDQFELCKVMFCREERTPLLINEVYLVLSGVQIEGYLFKKHRKAWNKVKDAVRKVNDKVREGLETDQELLECKSKEVAINKYFNWV